MPKKAPADDFDLFGDVPVASKRKRTAATGPANGNNGPSGPSFMGGPSGPSFMDTGKKPAAKKKTSK